MFIIAHILRLQVNISQSSSSPTSSPSKAVFPQASLVPPALRLRATGPSTKTAGHRPPPSFAQPSRFLNELLRTEVEARGRLESAGHRPSTSWCRGMTATGPAILEVDSALAMAAIERDLSCYADQWRHLLEDAATDMGAPWVSFQTIPWVILWCLGIMIFSLFPHSGAFNQLSA